MQLENPDEQCAYEHSGLLCGRCKSGNWNFTVFEMYKHPPHSSPSICPGWSDASPIPDCLQPHCLLGTINGLVFYANIVRVNHAFFFRTPATSALKVFQHVLAIFIISWLNLDLGIETCFFQWHGCSSPFHFTYG